MDNDVTPSPLSALLTAYGADDFLLVGGVFVIVLSSIFILSSSLPDQSAFATFPGENGKIAFVRIVEGNEEIYAKNADGSGQTRLTNHPSGDTYPDWSPDSTKIAFMSGRPNDYEIYVMNADGSNPTRLTEDPRSDTRPSWSPDGTRIAFVSERDGGLSRIYIVNADGSGLKRLTNSMSPSDGYGDPSWSPDGTKIAFSGGVNSATGIFVMNANDGSDQTLLSTDPRDSDPDWESIMPLPPPADTTAPVITVPEDTVVEDSGKKGGGQQVIYSVIAQDNVDGTATLQGDGTTIIQDDVGGNITISCEPPSGSTFPVGETTVQCTATDTAGNVGGPKSFTVTVNPPPPPPDTAAPVITVPVDMTEEATSPDGAQVSFEVTAEDEVDGPTDVDCDHNSGETFPIGETVVTCNAEDLAGNRADDKSFTITVQDTTAPDVEITDASDRRNGREIAEGSTTNMRYIEIIFQVTDAVGIDKTECSLDGQAFTSCTSPVVYDRLSRGSHQVSVRATDAAGNTGEDQFT